MKAMQAAAVAAAEAKNDAVARAAAARENAARIAAAREAAARAPAPPARQVAPTRAERRMERMKAMQAAAVAAAEAKKAQDAAGCKVNRVGRYTITKCIGRKTAIAFTLKGFDIKNMTPRKQGILDVFKLKIQKHFAQKFGLSPGDIDVKFIAGSLIAIADVAADAVPEVPPLGGGGQMLDMIKEVPGVEDLVEVGKTLADCIVDENPAEPVLDAAAAVGDPHLTTVYGEQVDLENIDLH